MAKVARNDPCPCGSGKKYKRCCLTLHEAAGRERQRLLDEPVPFEQLQEEIHDLTELANRPADLIRDGRLDDAERIAHELCERFPDQLDGLEWLARVYDARGDATMAAEQYRKAALFAERSGDSYDPELIAELRARATELEAATSSSESGGRARTEET